MPRPCSAGGKIKTAVESPVDLKALHAKIGQPTLENDFVTVAAHNTGSHGTSGNDSQCIVGEIRRK